MSELAKQSTAIEIPKEFEGFTEEEALGGMTPIQEGYLKSFKYFLSRPSMKAKFQIVNNETDEVVWEGAKIEGAVIYYGHEVLRLKKGHVESPGKNEVDFTDEENEILAVTYDAQNSKGNFESNGYGKYLTKEYADLQGKMRRLYIVMIIPSLKAQLGLELVAASFSVTTIKSFNALRKTVRSLGKTPLPLPVLKTDIFFSEAKSESGQEYDRIDFALSRKPDGSLDFAHQSADAYRTSPRGVQLLNKIIETHKGAVQSVERSFVGEREVKAISSFDETVSAFTEGFKGKEVPADSVPGGDEAPF